MRAFDAMAEQFRSMGVEAAAAKELAEEFQQATNHASQALQVLRRVMGDVHGSRPALQSAAYDAIKWASAICALLNEPRGVGDA